MKTLGLLFIIGLFTLTVAEDKPAEKEPYFSVMTINEPSELAKDLKQVKLNMPTNFSEIPWGSRLSGFLRLANPPDACSYISTVIKEDDDV